MPDLTSEDRRKGLDFANKLAMLAAEEAPDVRVEKIAQRAVNQIRQIYGYSPRLKMAELIRLVKVTNGGGGVTHAELIQVTGWHKDEVYDLVKQLETEQPARIEVRAIRPAGRGPGRPSVLIVAIQTSSNGNFSPPLTKIDG